MEILAPEVVDTDSEDDIEEKMKTLSLLKEKLAKLDKEEAELEAATVDQYKHEEQQRRCATEYKDTDIMHKHERYGKKLGHRKDRSSPSGDTESSPHRSHGRLCERLGKNSPCSTERLPKSHSGRFKRRESPRGSGERSSRRGHRNKDSPYSSSRERSPSRRRERASRKQEKRRSCSHSPKPAGDRDKSGKHVDLREILTAKTSSSRPKGMFDLREKLRSKKQTRDVDVREKWSKGDKAISADIDIDKCDSPSKSTRFRMKSKHESTQGDQDRASRNKSRIEIDVIKDKHSRRKSPSNRSEKETRRDRKTKERYSIEKYHRDKSAGNKLLGKVARDMSPSIKSKLISSPERTKRKECTFLTVGSQTIIKRHVNQLFIRGDNVVMVAIVD